MTNIAPPKVQLIAKSKSTSKTDKNFELSAGMGDAGKTLRIMAERDTVYELLDKASKKGPDKVRAKRKGRDLEVFLEGSTEPDAVIEAYYDEAIVANPGQSLTGVTSKGDIGIYVIEEGLRPALSTLMGDIMPIVLVENAGVWMWNWGVAGALAAGGLMAGGGGSSAPSDTNPPSIGGGSPAPSDTTAPSAPVVAATEGPLVNAAEAASEGGTPIVITLPADARVGDTVTTVVTAPDGTTMTLTRVIVAAELPAAQGGTATGAGPFTISQLVPSSALTQDGAWATSTTVTDLAGNVSPAAVDGFTLDATAPSAPAVAATEGPLVNAAEAASAGGTPIVTTLPADARVGDTVTTVVTAPDGTTLTLTHVIVAGELPAAQGGTATGAGPFTISQVVPSSALTQDGAWTTSTTITDLAGNVSPAAVDGFTLDANVPMAGDLLITGTVMAGPVKAGVRLEAYDQNGLLLGGADIADDGTYTITVTGKGDYRGTVLLKALDANGTGTNYLDEVTASDKSLDTDLRALGVAQANQVQFTITGDDAHLIINITPLTELAVRQAGVTGNTPVAADAALLANSNVATAFGLSGIALTGEITTTNSPDFDGRNGLSAGEKYGLALAKLSGLDSLQGGIDASLDALASELVGNSLTAAGALLVDQGRVQALSNLKATGSTFNAGGADADTNTDLNRWLLGDVIVTAQAVSANTVVIKGTALPGSTVSIPLGDGTSYTVQTDSNGNFVATLPASRVDTTQPLLLSGVDALAQAAQTPQGLDFTAPAAPVADVAAASDTGTSHTDNVTSDNTPELTGTGTPGDVITIKDASGHTIATATVGSNGSWSATPTAALPEGAQTLSVTATDAAGNTSPASALPLTIDTTPPAAPTVNPFTSNTLTPVLTGTATLAAGDSLTVTVSGATYAVTPDDQGNWSLNLATATPVSGSLTALVDGRTYDVVATVTDAAGNTSTDASAGELRINTSAPSVTLPEAAGGVNAAEVLSNSGTPLVVGLPATAVAGDIVTSVITKPDGTTLTLTTTLSSADITAGSITQVIADTALTGDNTLKLSLEDMLQGFDNSNVFNSSNTTSGLTATVTKNQLMVDGDAGDKVVLSDLASWTAAGTNVVANGHTYVAYNHNTSAQQLLIDQQIAVL